MHLDETIHRLEQMRIYSTDNRADKDALACAVAILERLKREPTIRMGGLRQPQVLMKNKIAGAPLAGTLHDVPNPYAEEGQES